jgi:colanic acid biosynthesis glycosyl transferase WcaI
MRAAAAGEILLLTQYFAPERIGSAPFMTDLAAWLAGHGAHVRVITSRPHYPEMRVYAGYEAGQRDRDVEGGVPVERVPTVVPAGTGAVQRLRAEGAFFLQALKRLRHSGGRADLVIALCPSILCVAAAVVGKRRGATAVAVVHDIQSGLAEGLGLTSSGVVVRLLRRLERWCLNRCALVVVLSEDMRERLLRLGVRRPVEVVPIWVDVDAITPMAPRPENPRLLYSGNFGRKQGLHQLVQLAAELERRGAGVDIVLRGAGNQEAELRAMVAAQGLKSVRFEPLRPAGELSQALADGDIHLVPQDPNGAEFALPSKLMSIMAAGRPFVATARSGSALARLSAESRAGIAVPPNDVSAFADAVLELAASAETRRHLGANGRRYAEENFSRAAVLSRLEAAMRAAGAVLWTHGVAEAP